MAGPPIRGNQPDPMSYEQWAKNLLKALGFNDEDNSIVAIVCWCCAEGTRAGFNPLATTQIMGDTHDFNSAGVQNYGDYDTGINATVKTLRNGNYAPILASLKGARDYVTTCRYIDTSPWGTKLATQIALSVRAGGGKKGSVYSSYAHRHINSADTGAGHSILNNVPGVGTVKDTVGAVGDALGSIGDAIGVLTDPHTWYRIGQVIFGAILIGLGLYMFVRGPASQLAGVAGRSKGVAGKAKGSFAKPKTGTELAVE